MARIELDIHPVQAEILSALVFQPKATFSQLNRADLPTDNFSFHLRRLRTLGLISKNAESYQLTAVGKEFANRIDTDTNKVERLAKPSVLVVVRRKDVAGKTRFLIQQRLKHPYYGYYGCLTGKVHWGESVLKAAKRELKEETGLRAKLSIAGVWHKIDKTKQGDLLEDKFFYIVRADNPTGEVLASFDGGTNHWMTAKEFHDVDNMFRDAENPLRISENNELTFQEATYEYEDSEY